MFACAFSLPGVAAAQSGRNEALEPLAACVRDRGALLVLVLMDESGSLTQTDPRGERVVAAQAAVASLESLTRMSVSGATPDVRVALSAFATDYTRVREWTPLDKASAESLRAELESFRQRRNGLDTDYAAAIDGARQHLAEAASAFAQQTRMSPCKALALFSDGDYDLELRNTPGRRAAGMTRPYAADLPLDVPGNPEKVVERGKQAICGPDGYRDQLVDDGVVLLTVALTQAISPEYTNWLDSVSQGVAGQAKCGTRASPANGSLSTADGHADLIPAFDGIMSEIAGGKRDPSSGDVKVCRRPFCAEGSRNFYVDESLRRFHLLARLGAADVQLLLRGPGSSEAAEIVPGRDGTFEAGGAQLRYQWLSPEVVTIDADLPRATRGWVGEWTVTFIDPTGRHPNAPAQSQIYLYGDMVPRLVKTPALRLGQSAPLTVEVVDSADQRISPATFKGKISVEAAVVHADSGERAAVELSRAGDVYNGSYPVQQDERSAFLVLELRATVTTSAGVQLAPQTTAYRLAVAPPVVYPRLERADLTMGSITGVGQSRGELRLLGGERDGCVWLGKVDIARAPVPSEQLVSAVNPAATDRASCQRVAAGQTERLQLTISNQDAASGMVTGDVELFLSVDGEDVIRQVIPLRFEMGLPVNRVVFALLIVLLLLGCLLPIGLLYLMNWYAAKFEPAHELIFAEVPSVVRVNDMISVAGVKEPLRPRVEDFQNLGGAATRERRVTVGSFTFRAVVSRSPFTSPFGLAGAFNGHVATSGPMHSRGERIEGQTRLALGGTWVFLLDELGTDEGRPPAEDELPQPAHDVHGTLLIVLSYAAAETFSAQVEAMRDQLQSELPTAARALAELARSKRQLRPEGNADAPQDGTEEPGTGAPDYLAAPWTPPVGAASASPALAGETGASYDPADRPQSPRGGAPDPAPSPGSTPWNPPDY